MRTPTLTPSIVPRGDDQNVHELRQRCDLQLRDVPFYLRDFVDRCEGRYQDIQLPLPMRIR